MSNDPTKTGRYPGTTYEIPGAVTNIKRISSSTNSTFTIKFTPDDEFNIDANSAALKMDDKVTVYLEINEVAIPPSPEVSPVRK